MPQFFRKLRLQSMNGKYLRYVMGEIFLVVVGILIALSIDNMNENRKERLLLEGYLKTIEKNLLADTVKINQRQRNYAHLHDYAKRHLTLAFQNKYSEEVLATSLSVMAESYLVIDQSGFEALKNSEVFKDLQGTGLEDALFTYYNSYKETYQEEISMNNFIESMEAKLYEEDRDFILDVLKWAFQKDYDVAPYTNPKEVMLKRLAWNPYIIGMIQRMADEDSPRYLRMKANAENALKLIDMELKK